MVFYDFGCKDFWYSLGKVYYFFLYEVNLMKIEKFRVKFNFKMFYMKVFLNKLEVD